MYNQTSKDSKYKPHQVILNKDNQRLASGTKNIHRDLKAQKIVEAITRFSHNIGTKVVAEFVHCQEVQEVVTGFDIDFSQGYLFSEPGELK